MTGEDLFNEIKDVTKKYYYFEDEESYDLLALFDLQCGVIDVLDVVFYLFIPGTKGAGKTNLLHLQTKLCKGIFAGNTTSAALKRNLPKEGGTMVAIDEYEGFTSDQDMLALQKIARQGYKKGETVDFCVGNDHATAKANPFGPKIIAFRGDINDDALVQRGFGISANRFDDPEGAKYVFANWNIELGDLPDRIKEEGKKHLNFDVKTYSNYETNPVFRDELNQVGIIVGANRDTEIAGSALVTAKIWDLDICQSLQKIMKTKIIAEKDTDEIAELADLILEMSKSRQPNNGTIRFTNKELKQGFDTKIGKPSSSGRFATIRREVGLRDRWGITPKGKREFYVPSGFIEELNEKYGNVGRVG